MWIIAPINRDKRIIRKSSLPSLLSEAQKNPAWAGYLCMSFTLTTIRITAWAIDFVNVMT